jgi:DNA-binding transcriptional LysR family regulator
MTTGPFDTPAGEQLLSTLCPALDEIEAHLDALTELRELPSGSLRLTAGRHAVETVLWRKYSRFSGLLQDRWSARAAAATIGSPGYRCLRRVSSTPVTNANGGSDDRTPAALHRQAQSSGCRH